MLNILSLLQRLVDYVKMDFVIHIMDNAHVILDGKEQNVIKKKLLHVQVIVEEVLMEYVNLMGLANVKQDLC